MKKLDTCMNDSPREASVITVSCLSGGSGKTTTTLNLATMLSEKGKTLAVDFDPQGNLSQWMGWRDLSETATIAETILPNTDRISISDITKSPVNEDRGDRLYIAPSDYSLSRASDVISLEPGRERFLRRALKPVLDEYEFIVIDSPPAKGILTYNAILAADFLVIPTECTDKGVTGAVNTVVLVQELEALEFSVPTILGIVPTRDQWTGLYQTRMSKAALDSLKQIMKGVHIFTSVRQSTLVQQANNMGWSLQESGEDALAKPYREIVQSITKIPSHV